MPCNATGQVVLKLKTVSRDRITHLEMIPVKFMQRLNVLLRCPHLNLRTTASMLPISDVISPVWVAMESSA